MALPVEQRIILDLCGGTGAWSKPYADAGYDVRNITLPDYDVRLYRPPKGVYGILAAPPCTEFSFAKHFHGKGKYSHNFLEGLSVVDACLRIILVCGSIRFWVVENPRGYLRRWLGQPALTFNPCDYGDPYKKLTDLWGWFEQPQRKPIKPISKKFSMLKTKEISPKHYGKLTRTERRGITPTCFAKAFFEANR